MVYLKQVGTPGSVNSKGRMFTLSKMRIEYR